MEQEESSGRSGFGDQLWGFARREPALFLGGAFVTGLLVARFLRASSISTAREEHAVVGTGMTEPNPEMPGFSGAWKKSDLGEVVPRA